MPFLLSLLSFSNSTIDWSTQRKKEKNGTEKKRKNVSESLCLRMYNPRVWVGDDPNPYPSFRARAMQIFSLFLISMLLSIIS